MNTGTLVHVVQIVTPQKVQLNGLWFGPQKPKRVVVWVHGLSSSTWSRHALFSSLVDKDTSVLAFSNRGHDSVARLSRVGSTKSEYAGGAHEVFTECVDDIQGALSFVKKQKVKDIFLAGHSTGCQKSVYWAHMRKSKGVKGIMLFAPLSDYLTILSRKKKVMAQNAEKYARKLVRERKRHQLLPSHLWPKPVDAQRFLSLYTPDSVEQSIFPYFDRARHSKMFSSVKVPIIAFFAGKDEHADRPTHAIAQWFAEQAESKTFVAHIVPKVGHSFRGGEMQIVKTLRAWFTE